ncbi:MAG: U32 family peptidase, partial [Firmicutes bacterium]|nr:U32 family peptidase [Candidatus Colimorpha enterica]
MIYTKLPELLAPAGTREALDAAVSAGADAVYFGGTMFNARMNAENFGRESIKEAVDFCHSKGVRAYVTLNTQIYDKELKSALEYAGYLYSCGVDALIIADVGLSMLIRQSYPDFPLHASTQMTVHNTAGADLLAGKGFQRVVVARELSRENIASVCRDSKPEIEAFVHGAICVSCSGQCLMSAMLGGRSGNRGQCAQPCRMSYNGSNPISIKDMCLAEHIPELISDGVASLKLEGRMKSPAYVGGVTEIYRRLLDEKRAAVPSEITALETLFSRGGFTDGYYTSEISGKMLGIRSENDKQSSRKIGSDYSGAKPRSLPAIEVVREEKTPVPVPRREERAPRRPFSTARFRSPSQIPDQHPFSHVYLPLNNYSPIADGVILPPVIFDSELDNVKKQLDNAVSKGAKEVMLGNISHLALIKDYPLTPHADFRFNVFNTETASFLDGYGLDSVLLSAELTLPQIRDIVTGRAAKGVVAYGRVPLMLLEKPVGTDKLRDTRNTVFPVLRDGRRDIIVNSVPVYMADQLDRLDKAGVEERHFLFTVENRAEVMRVIYAYAHGTI